MSIANQQTFMESGVENRPPTLEKGSYVSWASRLLRFLDNKQGEGKLMRNSIDNSPYKRKEITDPNDDTNKILEPINKLSQQNQNKYYADIKSIDDYKQNVQRGPRIASTLRKTKVQCYNCNKKGHYARECPNPRVSDVKYFREPMLLATKDEARVHLDEKENDFMLNNAYRDNTLEELNAAVIMKARIQPTDDDL
uniref:CCHC-type domain-containing protein n=1 Tax=Tanacetum cinerariifolium TaxID=118510 RepID=A0A6L2M9S4_TANCI|nr:hypothetical protein [Tanacetum cinerariifolium]